MSVRINDKGKKSCTGFVRVKSSQICFSTKFCSQEETPTAIAINRENFVPHGALDFVAIHGKNEQRRNQGPRSSPMKCPPSGGLTSIFPQLCRWLIFFYEHKFGSFSKDKKKNQSNIKSCLLHTWLSETLIGGEWMGKTFAKRFHKSIQ